MAPGLTALIYAISCWGLVTRAIVFTEPPGLQVFCDALGLQ